MREDKVSDLRSDIVFSHPAAKTRPQSVNGDGLVKLLNGEMHKVLVRWLLADDISAVTRQRLHSLDDFDGDG